MFIRTLLFMSLLGFISGYQLHKDPGKKVHKEIQKTFEIDQYNLQSVRVPDALIEEIPLNDKLYRIHMDGDHTAYAYVDQAPSKTAQFDYLVLLDQNLKIVKAKVLVYREEYGGEIGSNRWLRQFEGLIPGNRVNVGGNIDGIAGATISVRSMTKSMDELLQQLKKLKEEKIIE